MPKGDSAPYVRPDQAVEAIRAAAAAALPLLGGGRRPDYQWRDLSGWPELRTLFHRAKDDARRQMLVRLLLEEGRRVAHDEGAGL